MSDEKHIREKRILALKAKYDAVRELYREQREQCELDSRDDILPCLECDDPDSDAAVKEIIRRPHHKLNKDLLPECCCRRKDYFAKKKATAA